MTLFHPIFHPEPAWSSHTVSLWPALDMLDFSPHGIVLVSSNHLWLSSENCEMRVVLAAKGFRLGTWKLKDQTTSSFPLWLSQFTIQFSSITCFYLKLIWRAHSVSGTEFMWIVSFNLQNSLVKNHHETLCYKRGNWSLTKKEVCPWPPASYRVWAQSSELLLLTTVLCGPSRPGDALSHLSYSLSRLRFILDCNFHSINFGMCLIFLLSLAYKTWGSNSPHQKGNLPSPVA